MVGYLKADSYSNYARSNEFTDPNLNSSYLRKLNLHGLPNEYSKSDSIGDINYINSNPLAASNISYHSLLKSTESSNQNYPLDGYGFHNYSYRSPSTTIHHLSTPINSYRYGHETLNNGYISRRGNYTPRQSNKSQMYHVS